jgi:O-methyltransferase
MQYNMLWDLGQFLHLAPDGYYYEFGVCTGKAIDIILAMTEGTQYWSEITKRIDKPFKGVIGFDSFTGLPKENENVWHNPEWPEGAFNSLEVFKVATIEEVITKLYEMWSKYYTPIELVSGFYKESLTKELAESLKDKKASCIHIDCDIYQSTLECMDWIFANDLALPDSVWRFDDWISTPEWTAGESRAMLEISQKYDLRWNRLSTNMFQLKDKV